MLDNSTRERLDQLIATGRFDQLKATALDGLRRALPHDLHSVPYLMLYMAIGHFASRQHEQALYSVEQALDWARKVRLDDGNFLASALNRRACAQVNLGYPQEGLKTAMAAVRTLPKAAEVTVRFETYANAARMCLRLGSGDMSALFAREAWQVHHSAIPADHPFARWYAKFLYTLPICILAERGSPGGVQELSAQVQRRTATHLTLSELRPRQLMIEHHLWRSQQRLSSAQRILDEMFEVIREADENGLWQALGMLAQARLDLARNRPAHALQHAELARIVAARSHRRALEGEATEVWYEAYQLTGLPARAPRTDIVPAVRAFGPRRGEENRTM